MSSVPQTDTVRDLPIAFDSLATTLLDIGERLMYAGHLSDAITIVRHGVQIAGNRLAPPIVRSRLQIGYGRLLSLENFQGIGDFDRTLRILEDGRSIAADVGDRRLLADAIDLLGMTRYYRTLAGQEGSFEDSLPYFSDALAHRESLSDTRGIAESYFHLGLIDQNTGKWLDARHKFERAIAVSRAHEHLLELSYAVRHLGFVAQRENNLAAARALLEESLAIRERIGFKLFLPFSQLALADVVLLSGDHVASHRLAETALATANDIGSPSQRVYAEIALGKSSHAAGRQLEARDWYAHAQQNARSAGMERVTTLIAQLLTSLDLPD